MSDCCGNCAYYNGTEWIRTVGGSSYDEYDGYYKVICAKHSSRTGDSVEEAEENWCNGYEEA